VKAPGVLEVLADLYAASAAGRQGGARDFTVDYETFLRQAGWADGDEREEAERELARRDAEPESRLRIDRQARSAMPLRLRLARDGGEEWLFSHVKRPTPSSQRQALAAWLRRQAEDSSGLPATWQEGWTHWLHGLAKRAEQGESVAPLRRGEEETNHECLAVLRAILAWQRPARIRYASHAICGDSKRLEILEPRLRPALEAITGLTGGLEDFGIRRRPRSVAVHGPLLLHLENGVCDFSSLRSAYQLGEEDLAQALRLECRACLCLTVENEDVFHELVAGNPGILLIRTSYAGSAALRLLQGLPEEIRLFHFGDSDPAGSDILRDLRQRSGRNIEPLLMEYRQAKQPSATSLRDSDRRLLERLHQHEHLSDMREQIEAALRHGSRGDFEQEGIDPDEVWQALGFAKQR
jgi:hypothetical protein